MKMRRIIWVLIGLCLILVVVGEFMRNEGLEWAHFLGEFGVSIAFILTGLSMILDYRFLLDWLRTHLHWNYLSTLRFRIGGWFTLIFGLIGLTAALILVFGN
jgi:hypothetical protein